MSSRKITTTSLSAFMIILAMLMLAATARPTLAIQKPPAQRHVSYYTCLMDTGIKSRAPGKCPKCGMTLKAVRFDTPLKATADISVKRTIGKGTDSSLSLRIPDTTIYDQDGRRLNFYTDLIKGKTVAINFVFTTCTTICLPMTANFRKVQQKLGDRVGRDVEMISISVDPATDVPARLKDYTKKFDVGSGWTFVTGSKIEINELLKALGGYASDRNNHSPMVLVGNERAGYWTRTYGLASPAVIVGLVNEAIAKGGNQSDRGERIDEASNEREAATAATESQIAKRSSMSSATSASSKDDQAKGEGVNGKSTAGAASYFPNLVLVTQDNKPVHFYDDLLKGKIVVINFLFTTCTGICPPITANLAKVQSYLGDHVGREVNFISITVDPTTDTAAKMKKYAADFKAGPGWYFLTGTKENVDKVLAKLGGYVEDKADHSTRLIIGNEATGEWMKVMAMSKADEISDILFKMIGQVKD